MTVLINPGSRIGTPGQGWANTYETALASARQWLETMHAEGLTDVELLPSTPAEANDGRWRFQFRHKVTGTVVDLETHGIDRLDTYEKQHVCTPRVYWNGSSTSSPDLEDFAADGYVPLRTFRRA